jgi:SAM-dependent methyltransferase
VRLAAAIPISLRDIGQVERPFLETEQEALLHSTIAYYEKNADNYIAAWENDLPRAPMFAFLSQIKRLRRSPDPLRILDAGCGPGHHARFFANLGFAVTGIDRCARFIEYANSRPENGCKFIHGDMRRLDSHFQTRNWFDGVWACASCLHLARESLSNQLYQFAAFLRPKGVLGLSFQVGMPSGMKGSRFYERYDENDLLSLVETHGFRVEDNVRQVSTKGTEGPQVKSWMNLITTAPENKDLLEIPSDTQDTSAKRVGGKKQPRKRVTSRKR